jgi:hypothetical protein
MSPSLPAATGSSSKPSPDHAALFAEFVAFLGQSPNTDMQQPWALTSGTPTVFECNVTSQPRASVSHPPPTSTLDRMLACVVDGWSANTSSQDMEQSLLPQGDPYSPPSNTLGSHLPDRIRRRICANEYIDLAELLPGRGSQESSTIQVQDSSILTSRSVVK